MIGLLDTHGLIWSLMDVARLSERARSLLEDPANRVLVSAVSAWEIAIKVAQGRLTLPVSPSQLLDVVTHQLRMEALPITFEHAVAAATLPRIHGDPFDRLIVAQAQALGIPVITADPAIARYEVQTIW